MSTTRWLTSCFALPALIGMACAQEAIELKVAVPPDAAPVLVLDGVTVPANVGLRVTVHALGHRLGSASFVGSQSTTASEQANDRIPQVVIPLEPAVAAQLLADKKTVILTVTARTVSGDEPSTVKVERAYFRTASN